MAKMNKKRDRQLVLFFLGTKVFKSKQYHEEFKSYLKKDKHGICYLKTIKNEDEQKRVRVDKAIRRLQRQGLSLPR